MVREGKIALGGRTYLLALGDGDSDGDYSDLNTTELWIDTARDRPEPRRGMRAAWLFSVDGGGTYQVVSDVAAAGTKVTVATAGFGEVLGKVTSKTGSPVLGARVKLTPNDWRRLLVLMVVIVSGRQKGNIGNSLPWPRDTCRSAFASRSAWKPARR